ncbi:UNVERIFIED_CONTAM: hypothetical protein FKN15_044571 [Acipenser sinensis]
MSEGKVTVLTILPEKFNLHLENYKKPNLLYCYNGGYFLRVLPNGAVDGIRDRSDKHIQLQVTAETVGVVSIKGLEAGRYLAMSIDGQLCGSQTLTDECFFLETLEENHYTTYKAQKYQDRNWYVGIKKNGSCKSGEKTHIGQKAILFLPLSASSD